ncbi:methyltransferase [Microbacterium barkeri]|uniref:Methyltransferase n=1 Tax=Microbacterium barkeri TaxID=33917 RepID=A0A9W6H0A0_9MICO|nr:RsmD family RNA methyltransferase [Microbacterium barkeri]MDI6941955.1 RsmD family RNA methyltransferase [Microbacterium barkeri]MDR6875829.1 16S rRNA (guanine966-N2)-methyltransferase [Microbacterium barkeri]GLJ59946.1 methyltransferase [Microbacterium barkeri]
MTRIIAGRAGGARLDVPRSGTRPTSDRVRESLFGALEDTGLIEGAAVVDLYAGSGALGLECASRGAASVDLVERSRPAAEIVKRNVEVVRRAMGSSAPRVRVHPVAVRAFLRGTAPGIDIAFLDPPYDLPPRDLDDDLALLAPLLAPGALVIVERATRSGSPDWAAAGLSAWREKAYGDTTLWWGEPLSA